MKNKIRKTKDLLTRTFYTEDLWDCYSTIISFKLIEQNTLNFADAYIRHM